MRSGDGDVDVSAVKRDGKGDGDVVSPSLLLLIDCSGDKMSILRADRFVVVAAMVVEGFSRNPRYVASFTIPWELRLLYRGRYLFIYN